MAWLFRIPILGDVISYPYYLIGRMIVAFGVRHSGYHRFQFGSFVVWTPIEKKNPILDALSFLLKCDPAVYDRLTRKQGLTVYYSGRWKATNAFGRFSGLNDRYIQLGVQGVTTFLVQSLFLSEACPSINQAKFNPNRHGALRKVLDWMTERSFHPGMIESYRTVVEAWERKY